VPVPVRGRHGPKAKQAVARPIPKSMGTFAYQSRELRTSMLFEPARFAATNRQAPSAPESALSPIDDGPVPLFCEAGIGLRREDQA
jgi:hypothetical protein